MLHSLYCINSWQERAGKAFYITKTPYLRTLALTKFLLEFINQPIQLGGQSELFCLAQLKKIFLIATQETKFLQGRRSDLSRGICDWSCMFMIP
jgi:hypothetical protein